MRSWTCGVCGQLVFFENSACLRCKSALAFDWDDRELLTRPGRPRCANAAAIACNGLVDVDGELCYACAFTRTRPNDADTDAIGQWAAAERAKRRLLFEVGELGLPTDGLVFDLLSSAGAPVTTGHADGLITLDLAESDDGEREQRRVQMGEPYRTLLGHMRHEVGHFFFPVLVKTDEQVAAARACFGDEREDYQEALDRHYAQGPPADWADAYVSAYATMHPSEDWAETFAHVLHLHDALQTAREYGVRVDGPPGRPDLHAEPVVVEGRVGLREVLDDWLGLTYALNALNRSLGYDDLYPFVLSGPVVEKLDLVDDLVAGRR
jgi:hypothetical protein